MPVFFPLLIIVAIAVIAVLIFGCSASMIGYGLLKMTAKFGSSAPAPIQQQQPQPSGGGWAIQYSKNMPTQMTQASDGTYFFDFPNQDGVHYVVQNAQPLAIGRVITMTCSITGDGTIVPTEYPEHGPRVRLYMQRAGDNMSGAGEYQQYRYWSSDSFVPAIGDFELSVPLNADRWSDVFGAKGTDHQDGFIACIANAQVVGFTFGGDMAGHGDYVTNGSARFILKSFTIT